MKCAARVLIVICVFAFALPAFADDQEKAQKEIKRITAITQDTNMRSLVNRTMAEMFNANRVDLVKDRRNMNLNYGGLFLERQLVAAGAKPDDIAAQLKTGKSIFDIANDQHANWKQINNDAKKMNKKIDDNIEKYFQNTKKETEKNSANGYIAGDDHTSADQDVSKEELVDAQSRYQHVHDLAAAQLPVGDANTKNFGAGSTSAVAPPLQPTQH